MVESNRGFMQEANVVGKRIELFSSEKTSECTHAVAKNEPRIDHERHYGKTVLVQFTIFFAKVLDVMLNDIIYKGNECTRLLLNGFL